MDLMTLFALKKGSNGGVEDHCAWNLERLELEGSEPRSLLVGTGLGKESML
jgi:hypothetical protein